MKGLINYLIILFFTVKIEAQVLNVPETIQENNQWCWAGVSKSILDYYGFNQSQCEIADYARQVISWHDFGSTDCCLNPNLGCNYWNYNWGYPGSIEDIIAYFGSITSYGDGRALELSEINYEISEGRPFVVRWGWNTGGGHFVLGHGVNSNDVYYMDPWFNEGLHVSTYDWLVNDGTHNWTHTNVLTTNVNWGANVSELGNSNGIKLYPNPSNDEIRIDSKLNCKEIKVYTVLGQAMNINQSDLNNKYINIQNLESGTYLLKAILENDQIIAIPFVIE